MAKFRAVGNAVFQDPIQGRMGFCVCVCDNGCGVPGDNAFAAQEIARCLNQDDDVIALKPLLLWLIQQKTVYLNRDRRLLINRILAGKL